MWKQSWHILRCQTRIYLKGLWKLTNKLLWYWTKDDKEITAKKLTWMSESDTPKSRFDTSSLAGPLGEPPIPKPPIRPIFFVPEPSNISCCHLLLMSPWNNMLILCTGYDRWTWIGKVVDSNGCGLCKGTIPAFYHQWSAH